MNFLTNINNATSIIPYINTPAKEYLPSISGFICLIYFPIVSLMNGCERIMYNNKITIGSLKNAGMFDNKCKLVF